MDEMELDRSEPGAGDVEAIVQHALDWRVPVQELYTALAALAATTTKSVDEVPDAASGRGPRDAESHVVDSEARVAAAPYGGAAAPVLVEPAAAA